MPMTKTINQLPAKAVMDTVLDGLVVIDGNGIVCSFNHAAELIFQYSSEEVIGRNVSMLMAPHYRDAHDGYLESYLRTGVGGIIGSGREVVAVRKDGTHFSMDLGVNEMRIGDDRMFIGTIRDVTGRKLAEALLKEEADRLRTVLDVVVDGVITIDSKGIILSFSPAAERITLYRKDEVIGKNVKILMPEPFRHEHDDYLRHYHDTGIRKIIGIGREVRARRKNGEIFPMELAVNQMVIQGEVQFVGTIRDISDRRQAEDAAKAYIEKLKRSNEDLDEFAYIASHDLKEPLRGLSNNAEFLYEDYQEVLGDDGKRRLDRIQYLCTRLEGLVDELLYFSRLGRQELAVQRVNPEEIIEDICSLIDSTIKSTNTTITVETPMPQIVCDVPRMTEVFRNLITNAIKYNDKEYKYISVGCSADDRDPNYPYTFYIRDNGVGIDSQFFTDVFRIFKRLNVEDDQQKGHGVGLTFVKKIIERHEGRIWLESTPGEGTTFYFTIKQNSFAGNEA